MFSLKASFIIFCFLMILVSPYIIIRVIIDTLISAAEKEQRAYMKGVKPKFTFFEWCAILIGHICFLNFLGDIF